MIIAQLFQIKNKIVAIKEDEIILEGIKNYLDGLWDIPIEKSRLQSDNYNDPTLHGFQLKKYE